MPMPLLLLLLGFSVFGYAWIARRCSSLTRACKWRMDRRLGPSHFHCIACGATCDPGQSRGPRDCLRATVLPPKA
jgi:hypothetical protein